MRHCRCLLAEQEIRGVPWHVGNVAVVCQRLFTLKSDTAVADRQRLILRALERYTALADLLRLL